MNFRGHILTGIVFFGLFVGIGHYAGWMPFRWLYVLIGLPLTLYAAILPDVDIHSVARKVTVVGLSGAGIYNTYIGNSLWIYICFASIAGMYLLSHRGITHTWLFGAGVFLFAYFWVGLLWSLFLLLGFFSHLMADKIPLKVFR
ncbi:MAG: metal-dependent hydrolase [bacterium]|nr:metal-dependent hydrolase [bacterium]